MAYRQQGGYAQQPGGKLAEQVWAQVQQGEGEAAVRQLRELSEDEAMPEWIQRFVPKLLAVLGGERDGALADDEALSYASAAEVLLRMGRMTHLDLARLGHSSQEESTSVGEA